MVGEDCIRHLFPGCPRGSSCCSSSGSPRAVASGLRLSEHLSSLGPGHRPPFAADTPVSRSPGRSPPPDAGEESFGMSSDLHAPCPAFPPPGLLPSLPQAPGTFWHRQWVGWAELQVFGGRQSLLESAGRDWPPSRWISEPRIWDPQNPVAPALVPWLQLRKNRTWPLVSIYWRSLRCA